MNKPFKAPPEVATARELIRQIEALDYRSADGTALSESPQWRYLQIRMKSINDLLVRAIALRGAELRKRRK